MKRALIQILGGILFASAFFVPAVRESNGEPYEYFRGWQCAKITAQMNFDFSAKFFPVRDLKDALYRAPWMVSGWISPLVLVCLVLSLGHWWDGTRRILSLAIPILMIAPFLVFHLEHLVPVVGHFDWMAGALTILAPELSDLLLVGFSKAKSSVTDRTSLA